MKSSPSPALLLGTVLFFLASLSQAAILPSPPEVDAKGWILMDFASGSVLAEHEADTPMEPASLTKILAAYVVFREIRDGNIALTDEVTISENAWKTGGSKMFIEVNTRVSVEDLLHGLIIQSGNDAGVALAEHIAGSESTFAQLMNSHAKRLGMANSHFMNSNGLPEKDHYTTARDLALVTQAMIREFPQFYAWYSQRDFTYNNIKQNNRNLLLNRDDSVDGVKTGHTEAAGYCLVSSAKRDEMRLISVVMGTSSPEVRARESLALLNYGFRFYESYQLYKGNVELRSERIWKGDQEMLSVGIAKDLAVAVPRGQFKNLNASMEIQSTLEAPISRGQTVGSLTVKLEGGSELATVPLIALQDIAEGGIWQRTRDMLLQRFE